MAKRAVTIRVNDAWNKKYTILNYEITLGFNEAHFTSMLIGLELARVHLEDSLNDLNAPDEAIRRTRWELFHIKQLLVKLHEAEAFLKFSKRQRH